MQTAQSQTNSQDSGAFNMNLDANEIHRFSNMTSANNSGGFNQMQNENQRQANENQYQNSNNLNSYNRETDDRTRQNVASDEFLTSFQKEQLRKVKDEKDQSVKNELNFVSLAEQLMQLEELRKAGLINDQEYQELKRKCI